VPVPNVFIQVSLSDKVPPPPGVAVAARRIMQDPNDEPQYGERVPYVIMRGQPNSRLVDRAVAPLELLEDRYFYLSTP
jgi:DNA polymerase zeta